MAKWKNILFWSLGVIVLITVFAFSSKKSKNLIINNINIHIDHSQNLFFVNKDEIKQIVKDELSLSDTIALKEINIAMLEETIDNHPSIYKAEVYSTLDGSLSIDVFQKQPIARVKNPATDYYIDAQGDIMTLSTNFTATVPLVIGDINDKRRLAIYNFLEQTQQDAFYKDFFSGIEITDNDEWLIYPKAGRYTIQLGKIENWNKKLKKLKTFYQNVVTHKNINDLKTINLKYEGQVICRKYG